MPGRKTKKQAALAADVSRRLNESGPVRLDASAVVSGRVKEETEAGFGAVERTLNAVHPSLEGATEALRGAGLQGGTITTADGLSVRVSREKNDDPNAPYNPQATDLGSTAKSAVPLAEGVSQMYETPIGRQHGPEAAARHVAEAEKIAQRPNPLRSDGLVDAVMALHTPSMGGNRLGRGGAISGLAKQEDMKFESSPLPKADVPPGSNISRSTRKLVGQEAYATGPRDLALKSLGYTDTVQNMMLSEARSRVSRRQGRLGYAALSPVEIEQRAQGQVQEHLDEALHGTKRVDHDSAIVRNAVASEGVSIWKEGQTGTVRVTPQGKSGPGMTKSTTPNRRAQKAAIRGLVRGGKWSGHSDYAALSEAVKNDNDRLAKEQKARRAAGPHPETFNTMAPGADVDQKERRFSQPLFSTGPRAPWAASDDVNVGLPQEGKPLPPQARPGGGISPVPTNLKTEPAPLGRSRSQRGGNTGFPKELPAVTAPKPGETRPARKAVPSGSGGGVGNWSPGAALAGKDYPQAAGPRTANQSVDDLFDPVTGKRK